MPTVKASDHFQILKGWDLGDAAQVMCPECETRFFVEGATYEGNAPMECPKCGRRERRDFMSMDSPPLTL